MQTLTINHNYNGKLFNDNFSHIEPFSMELEEGMELELKHQGETFGIVEIRKIKMVAFSRITEMMAILICGKPLHYLAAMLNQQYNKGVPHPADKLFMHMVLGYKERNIINQTTAWEQYWAQKSSELHTLKTQS